MHSLEELLQKTLDEVGALTNSPIGFYHFIESDQKTISLQAWSTRTLEEFCKAEGKGLHYPISRAGVWVDCVHQRRPVIHNDYSTLSHRKGMPEGHAPVIRELVVPIMRSDRIVAILGIGNKLDNYTEQDVEVVSYLADVAWEITMRKQAEDARRLNESRLETLLQLNQMTDATLREISEFAMEEAVRLTQSTIGYVAFMNEDETVLTMHACRVPPCKSVGLITNPSTTRSRPPVFGVRLFGNAVQSSPTITGLPTPSNEGLRKAMWRYRGT